MLINELLPLLQAVKTQGKGYQAKCPAHDDQMASLSIAQGDKGIVLHCHAGCTSDAVCAALGIKMADLFAEQKHFPDAGKTIKPKPVGEPIYYSYHDDQGNLIMQAKRQQLDNGKKLFSQRLWLGDCQDWSYSIPKNQTRFPYRLPSILQEDNSRIVFICEGEKDVDEMVRRGFIATTNIGGAGKWVTRDRDDHSKWLKGRKVVILPDNDDAGRAHAQQVAQALHGIAEEIKIVELPGLEPKGDAYDWWQAGGTVEALKELYKNQTPWLPSPAGAQGVNPPSAPAKATHGYLHSARLIVEKHFCVDGHCTLKRWRDNWYRYNGKCYEATKHEAIVRDLYQIIDNQGVKTNKKLIAELMAALPAASDNMILNDDIQPPIDSHGHHRKNLVSVKNGILNVETRKLVPHTPALFTVNTLPFDYEPEAKTPIWDDFLAQLFLHDYEAAITLQQWFGYCLSDDMSYQKILLVKGPMRAGKGTISRTLTELLGENNVANPSLTGLYAEFGLEPLLDKKAALIGDGRLSGRSDQAIIIERLLNISGEDRITINRKNKPLLAGVRLNTKIVLFTNELPSLPDSSGALASRFLPIELVQSFLGREDRDLQTKINRELPGILNWALDGLALLNANGFRVSERSDDITNEFTRLSSIVTAFTQDCCDLGPEYEISKDDLYDAWSKWCDSQGYQRVKTKNVFARDLRAACPQVDSKRGQINGQRANQYTGIKLNISFYTEYLGKASGMRQGCVGDASGMQGNFNL